MRKVYPLANPENYIHNGQFFYLLGDDFLALPGAVTQDPKEGSQKYNDCLVNRYLVKSDMRERVNDLLIRHNKNRRIIKLRNYIKGDIVFSLKSLTQIEVFLFNKIISFGSSLLNRQLT